MAELHVIEGGTGEVVRPKSRRRRLDCRYRQLGAEFDSELGAVWSFMQPQGVPCFNLGLLGDIADFDRSIEAAEGRVWIDGSPRLVRYYVGASDAPGVYNLGGDLTLFAELALARDRDKLLHYAMLCVDNLFRRISAFRQPIVTIALIQGDALGGGFEAALANHVIIAERSAKMGFPEILFNLFPGMGAYSFLSRRVGLRRAEDLIYSGATVPADELCELGVIDYVAEDGKGEELTEQFMREHLRRHNGYSAILQARGEVNPVTREELARITTHWVDAVLRLDPKDVRTMQRLVRAQHVRSAGSVPQAAEPAAPAAETVESYA